MSATLLHFKPLLARFIHYGIGGLVGGIAIVMAACPHRHSDHDQTAVGNGSAMTGDGMVQETSQPLSPRSRSSRERISGSGKAAATEGSQLAGITPGLSAGTEVEARFGPPDTLQTHGTYSTEMIYSRLGLSFYYRGGDANNRIFHIKARTPFKLRTDAGISLGKSTMADVLKAYGNLHWISTRDGDYWWSEHDGVEYYVLRDKSVPQFPLDEKLYLNQPIIGIDVKGKQPAESGGMTDSKAADTNQTD